MDINYLKIPVKLASDVNEFNDKYLELYYDDDLHKIVRTKSGGISQAYKNVKLPMWDCRNTNSVAEITYIGVDEEYRFQFRATDSDNEDEVPGGIAFREIVKMCKKYKIDLSKYEVSNGKEVVEEIEPYMIKVMDGVECGITYEHVYHLDLNSSYWSNICYDYPELWPVAKEIYSMRKGPYGKYWKGVLCSSYGYFRSQCCNYKYAKLAKSAVNGNNEVIRWHINEIMKQGKKPILINTDGIWYISDDGPYLNFGLGTELGQYKNDHFDCKFRIKSAGAYEFIEDGIYHPVIRGVHNDVKKDWVWGDIFRKPESNKRLVYDIKEGIGLVPRIKDEKERGF